MISDKYTFFFHNGKKIFKRKKIKGIGLKKSPDHLILVFFLVATQS